MSSIYSANTATTTTDSNPLLAQPEKDLNHYRQELKGLWRKTVTDILETGRVFAEAKDDLTPAEYKDLMAEFGFERSMAARLRRIYECLSGVDNYLQKRLRASASTIYEMSKVGPELLEAKLKRGEWTTTTTRADIRPPKTKELKKEPSPVNRFRRFYEGKGRQTMIDELVEKPALEANVLEEINALFDEVRKRRRLKNGQDNAASTTPPEERAQRQQSKQPGRWGYGGAR